MQPLEEAFVKVSFHEEQNAPSGIDDPVYQQWIVENASSTRESPILFGERTLRELYPDHSIVMTEQSLLLGFPGALIQPLETSSLIANTLFIPMARRTGVPGALLDQIEFTALRLAWDSYDFLVYILKYPKPLWGWVSQHFILHKGSETPSRQLLLAAGAFSQEVHNEVWMFQNGFWSRNVALYEEMQKANWDDVILNHEFKDGLKKDVYGFFRNEKIYKDLAIPWKRGLIMYGPPGNGKTISLKAIMKDCNEKGYLPLYVKSFKSWMGEENSMAECFRKARELAPCCLILEDLDSLINNDNRSFFLNQLDGLEGNDGILVIGTTNHLDQLDPALTTRPSRFDRKYDFKDPEKDERALYCKYWQSKLASSKSISFPDSLVTEIAEETDRFSFAYLKEAFVSTLVLMATAAEDGKKLDFEPTIKSTIKTLRKQLNKPQNLVGSVSMGRIFAPQTSRPAESSGLGPLPPKTSNAENTLDLHARAQAAIAMGRSYIY
ncbi:P-loop containing nucleoside triphosphate hydrolase protein [Punctularia strigosozonata HHB-11173 SS5]|uniref:P-loop containing nucleoside triphosphate hydrolase protein n=1 Tax=Punctularia strigosozonata (strain HHB-11173) TaxID=741275 RepID=UPI000441861A|nr:P-loop containing nucleoside triphosphate hydrolase protein [Punctularia strigosozonata HHB-11173 SS5]EIN10929.1 P-loop containing nucleoside triphosphate hydrolase protein [Punctularia strigosozonata HHB-11173 SS5]